MELKAPINNVAIHVVSSSPSLSESPICQKRIWCANENELTLQIEHIASYKIQDGTKVDVYPHPDSDADSVQLFLNGSVLGCILHQRKTLPFHGSSFFYKNKGVLISGNSGAGKSSVVAAFCSKEGLFVNDDITPVYFNNGNVSIMPIKTKIKLWDDAINLLGIDRNALKTIRPLMEKYYVSEFAKQEVINPILNTFILLRVHHERKFQVERPQGIQKFNYLRENIYRKIYLKGMPETERYYFTQLIKMANILDIVVVYRPKFSNAIETMEYIREHVLL